MHVRLSYQEALEQVWITLVQVRLHGGGEGDGGGPWGQKAQLCSAAAFVKGALCLENKGLCSLIQTLH